MNRHVKIALIMAPILALASYGITGYFQPKIEQKAGDYELRLTGSCRPSDNSCVLTSGDFEIMLISSIKNEKRQLGIVTNLPIAYMSLAMSNDNHDFIQFKMMKSDDKKYWQVALEENQKLELFSNIRLAANAGKSNYFIETAIQF